VRSREGSREEAVVSRGSKRKKAQPEEEQSTRVTIYARVSTNGNGQSPEVRTREPREYCDRRGWSVAGEYVDMESAAPKKSGPN
jgi:Resolvase, N terminal domain